MTLKTIPLTVNGLNNRASDTALPPDKARNAVNVDFDNAGQLIFPRIGNTKVYTGTACHSWFEYEHNEGLGLFVEGTDLKLLESDYTATTLKSVGDNPMSYAERNDVIYFSNGVTSGKYQAGAVTEWGVDVPPMQPIATATPTGGMYGGDYRIAITWMIDGEESGTFNSRSVTVEDGGGIRLSQFPTPPSTVDGVSVYVSAVNSKDLYLYTVDLDEYPANVSEIFIRYSTGVIPLTTQFGIKVKPKLGLTVYNGGIFWMDGELVRYTDAHHLGLYRSHQFFDFEHTVKAIAGIPTGPLYVLTERALYRVDGVYTEAARLTKVKSYGGSQGAVFYDDNDNVAYLFTDNGMVRLSAAGVEELHAKDVATPTFDKGSLTVIEKDGTRRLIAVMQGGTINKSQHAEYTAAEVARGGTGL